MLTDKTRVVEDWGRRVRLPFRMVCGETASGHAGRHRLVKGHKGVL